LVNYLDATRSHTDIVHKTIPYSSLENKIIDTKPLLRLHRVSQNSLVFLTFTPNKVKRFEHSLGVMHLAGKLFQSAISNTKTEIINEMLESFEKELNDWINKKSVRRALETNYGRKLLSTSDNYKLCGKSAPFVGLYNAHTPQQIKDEWNMLYIVLYQGVRIAALLHDVGHLPYSHTIEKVLGILKSKWETKSDSEITTAQREYLTLIKDYVSEKNESVKLHEAITIELLPIIESECMKSINEELKSYKKDFKDSYLLLCLYSFEVAKRILNTKEQSKGVIYNILHGVISGTLDADRLDYVSRDLLCSGVSNDIINYERIFMFLSFEKNDNQNIKEIQDKPYLLTVASKTVGDIEDFLRKRWKSYRDVNYHHSVHKSELFMRNILIGLAESSNNNINEQNIPDDFLLGVISVLKALKEDLNDETTAEKILRLDDSWLDTIIKKHKKRNAMIDELVYGRKRYRSVIKRFEDFFILDKKVYELFCQSIENSGNEESRGNVIVELFSELNDVCLNVDDSIYDEKNEYLQSIIDVFVPNENKMIATYEDYLFGDHEFFINYVIDKLDRYKEPIKTNKHLFKALFFNELEKKLRENESNKKNSPDDMLGVIDLDDGIEDDCFIRRERIKDEESRVGSFVLFSGIRGYLHAESMLHPLFHYYCKLDMNLEQKMDDLAQIIFELLTKDIIISANELISDMKQKVRKSTPLP